MLIFTPLLHQFGLNLLKILTVIHKTYKNILITRKEKKNIQ